MCEVICPYCGETNDTESIYEYEEDCLELVCEYCSKIMSVALFPEPYAVKLPFEKCEKCGREIRFDELINGTCKDCAKKETEEAIKRADKFLKRVKNVDILIKSKETQAERLEELATKTTTSLKTYKIKEPNKDYISKLVAKISDLKYSINHYNDSLMNMKNTVNEIIDNMSDNDYKILLLEHYINGKTIEDTAEILQREVRYTYKLKKKALLEFEKDMLRHVKTV